MLRSLVLALVPGALVLGCSSGSSGGGMPVVPTTPAVPTVPTTPTVPTVPTVPTTPTTPVDDLAALSDDFSDPGRFGLWQRIHIVEQWGFDQLESQDVGTTRPGWLTSVPYTSGWYEDYRGELTFKEVTGDVVATARVQATNRAGTGAPGREYSLAGIMVRAPRSVTPATWTRGGEHYVFLSVGAANAPGTYQTEVKTTRQSVSVLEIGQAAGPDVRLRVARIGAAVICLMREETTPWRVHRRYTRADLPGTLQVGMTVYTDWENVQTYTYEQHNTTQITNGSPDLRAQFDFVEFERPVVPASLAGRDLADPAAVSDPELLAFLGQD